MFVELLVSIIASAAIAAAAQTQPLPYLDLSKRECKKLRGVWDRGCRGPRARKLLPLNDQIEAEIESALAQQFGKGAEIVEATRELRTNGEVVCGVYATPNDRAGNTVRPFSWFGGKLVIDHGGDWDLGVLCLMANYSAPLS